MKNLAPAIFPPTGIGDAKPSNKAVLDWVHEIATLTQPENIFWCDGSEREREFLIAESLKQNVLIQLNEKKVPRSYLHQQKRKPVRRTTGLSREKRTQGFVSYSAARCADARCSSFPT